VLLLASTVSTAATIYECRAKGAGVELPANQ
jgi:hypothetical protein